MGSLFNRLLGGLFVFVFLQVPAAHARLDAATDAIIRQANADPAGWLNRVLAEPYRPTLSSVVDVLQSCSACLDELGRLTAMHKLDNRFLEQVRFSGPSMIAHLEAFYPNGLYATLGRDSVSIADVLEAFYHSLGVSGRVVRLGLSGPSFAGFAGGITPLQFLRTNGYDRETALSGERPFVIIDRTNYSSTSQSARLLASCFRDPDLKPRDVSRLALSLGVVGTTNGENLFGSPEQVQSWKIKVAESASWNGGLPPHLLGFEMTEFDDRLSVWHQSFTDRIVELPDGRLSGVPGFAEPGASRLATLLEFWHLHKLVASEAFRASVFEEAQKRGFDLFARLSTLSVEIGARAASESRLQSIIEADLRGRHQELNGASERDVLQEVIDARVLLWRKLSSTSDSRASAVARAFNRWRHKLEQLRANEPMKTGFGRLLFELVIDLPVLTEVGAPESLHIGKGGKRAYFSANAQTLIDAVRELQKRRDLGNDELADLIRLVEFCARLNLISLRDDRRLVLYALAHVRAVDSAAIGELRAAIDGSPIVKRFLIDKAKVFLTSTRFNTDRARQVYMGLVEAGILPYPGECAAALDGDRED